MKRNDRAGRGRDLREVRIERTGGVRPEPSTVVQMLDNLWRKACAAEGIDPAAKFVVFSPNNNYANMHGALLASVMRMAGRA